MFEVIQPYGHVQIIMIYFVVNLQPPAMENEGGTMVQLS
jgi:hypothetical protein